MKMRPPKIMRFQDERGIIALSFIRRLVPVVKGAAFLIMLGWTGLTLSHAQSTADCKQHSSFEVATIRQTAPGDRGNEVWSPPGIGRFWAKSVSLSFLVQMAFDVDEIQISQKPAWLESEFFDVDAKPEGGIVLTRDQLRPLLRDLLEQRFHLVTHREMKMVKGYALMVAKGGTKLQPTKADRPPGFRLYTGPGRLEGLNWSIAYLATMLTPRVGLPVIDKTGVAGSYDIKLEFAPELESDSAFPSIFIALQESLGLRLSAQKVPTEMLAIDHVDRFPTAN